MTELHPYAAALVALVMVPTALLLSWSVGARLMATVAQLVALRRGRRRHRLDELPVGQLVGLRGHVAAIDKVTSPSTGREAVYIERTEEAWDSTPNVIGAAGKWVCVAHSEEAAPFELTDGERAVLVDPAGAEVLAPVIRGVDPAAGTRFVEALIGPGDPVVVVGHVVEQGGFAPHGGYRGSPFRRVVATGPRGLLIATPRLLRGRLAARLAVRGALLSASLAAAALALLVAAGGSAL